MAENDNWHFFKSALLGMRGYRVDHHSTCPHLNKNEDVRSPVSPLLSDYPCHWKPKERKWSLCHRMDSGQASKASRKAGLGQGQYWGQVRQKRKPSLVEEPSEDLLLATCQNTQTVSSMPSANYEREGVYTCSHLL